MSGLNLVPVPEGLAGAAGGSRDCDGLPFEERLGVHGHEKVLACGQIRVPADGQEVKS
jgi:hypothetical protein